MPGSILWSAVVLNSLAVLADQCAQALGQQLLASGRVAGQYDPVTGLAYLPLMIGWPGTTIWAAFEGSASIGVTFELPPGDTFAVNTSLAFDLDGQTDVRYVTSGMLPYTWSMSGLSESSHALKISKRSETLYGVLMLTGMNVSASGRSVHRALQSRAVLKAIGKANTENLKACNKLGAILENLSLPLAHRAPRHSQQLTSLLLASGNDLKWLVCAAVL